MTLVELKKSIHERIDNLEDEALLEMVNAILLQNDNIFMIPKHMKEGIRQGEQDIKNGDVYSMKDFETKYSKWLKG